MWGLQRSPQAGRPAPHLGLPLPPSLEAASDEARRAQAARAGTASASEAAAPPADGAALVHARPCAVFRNPIQCERCGLAQSVPSQWPRGYNVPPLSAFPPGTGHSRVCSARWGHLGVPRIKGLVIGLRVTDRIR